MNPKGDAEVGVQVLHSRNEFDFYHGVSKLEKVDPLKDELCSIFRNGTFAGGGGNGDGEN